MIITECYDDMPCSVVDISLHLGHASSKTHPITVKSNASFNDFRTLICSLFHIPPYILQLSYLDEITGETKVTIMVWMSNFVKVVSY